MTEAKWIQKWLLQEFKQQSFYVPNGLDTTIFYKTTQPSGKKLRVLLEGPLTIPFKGVADAYEAVRNLNCEIWIVSSDGSPPKHWKYDKFFEKVPINEMKDIYSSCDILLKMSRVEGFFGPPMEAMACGCAVVVAKCTGYDEYIVHEKNALVVEQGDIKAATKQVKRLLQDDDLRKKLMNNGYDTVKDWTWERSLQYLEAVICNKQSFSPQLVEPSTNKFEKFDSPKEISNYCDIIIVVHNAVQVLQKCIESIKKYTDYNHNIIVVDNNSNYETKNYLKTLQNVKIITNQKNYGFGYANNIAVRQSNSKYVCFLNSDTIVSDNWLSRMIEVLETNKAGLIGPVSNSVSSEIQKIDYPHDDSNDSTIQDFSNKRYKQFDDKVIESNRLIGFCLLTKREILNKSGLFDDRYEFNFEDDDLCLRIIEQGYRLFCALGVFIYHFGGQSFKDEFKTQTNTEILETSRVLYTKKWYETERIKYIRKKKDKFSIIYLLASDSPSGGVKVVFEHANRLKDRGYNVEIWCNKNVNSNWFELYAPINYFSDYSQIPKCDIAIGTYFTTLPILQKLDALVKIHLCQGYEAALYDPSQDQPLILTIKDDYRKIKEKIVVSKWLKETIDNEFEIDSHLIPNGLDQYIFSFSTHSRNPIPKILIVGNYNLQIKGINIAIQAVSKYLETHRGSIIRMASEKTRFDEKYTFYDMSKMSQDEIAKIYESCDITVCASFKVEGFSLPPLESMASGTPVITTDNGGVNEYAINNENAIIVSPGNIRAIQHALELVLSNNSIYSRFVENGLKTANNYLWYQQIDKLEELLHRLYKQQKDNFKEQLSVCMIVKNEEDFLDDCLDSIKDLANELIIVDTGSTDETIRIAKRYGAKLFHFDWNNDFSAARNFALSKVTQPWIFILDADEVISQDDIPKIRELLRSEKIAYNFTTRNYVTSKNIEGIVLCSNKAKEEKDFIGWCPSTKIRLFPSNLNIQFEGEIHELVENSIDIPIQNVDIPIHHYGIKKRNKEKENVYLELNKKKAETNESKALYELALQYMTLNNNDEAIVIWRKLLETEPDNPVYLSHIGTTFNLLNDYEQAEKYFLDSISIEETEYALKHLGICYAKQNRFEDAYTVFKKIVYKTDDLKTMADFAFCCNTLKKFDEAIVILEKCLKLNRKETVSWGLLELAYNEKGIELAKKNRIPQSINMFKSALMINSNFDVARANLTEVNKLLNTKTFSKTFIK